MTKQQVKTYFGVAIPPFKEEKLGSGGVTIRFILTGITPSKKNNQMSVAVRKYARGWAKKEEKTGRQPTWRDVHKAISLCRSKVRSNAQYNAWVEKMKPILHQQCKFWVDQLGDKGLIFPLKKSTLSLRMYFKSRYVQDTLNKQQSIHDLLQSAGIISNDDYKTINPYKGASACYYEEILQDIAYISLSFKIK